ncbi:hypothetical protein TCAL_14436 [Tigriopus californicus]|uniref:Ig-like domain-containing protein n=1 Tax=Tigriopus californicus TaxID=6832 RepID=A0A553PLS1_TIGCA|nr:hypothetical protein TCAL_14436 [Tigriopus californicus]
MVRSLFWIPLALVAITIDKVSSFKVTTISQAHTVVQEGESLVLQCSVDDWYEWCTFRHKNKKCDFQWRKDVYNITVLDCQDYEGRFQFQGQYNNNECGIEIENVAVEDGGEWVCEFENYYNGYYRGYGYQAEKKMTVEVKILTTTTTTTTTTSTTTTTTPTIISTASTSRMNLTIASNDGDPRDGDDFQANNNRNSEDDKLNERVEDDITFVYFLTAFAIGILILLPTVLFCLKIKGKLPNTRRNTKFGENEFQPISAPDDQCESSNLKASEGDDQTNCLKQNGPNPAAQDSPKSTMVKLNFDENVKDSES